MSSKPLELHLLAVRAKTAAPEAFQKAVVTAGQALGARTAFRIDLQMGSSAHTEATAHADPPADAVLTWPVPGRNALDAQVRALEMTRPVLDLPRSTLLETERHDIVPGTGTVMIFFALHRLARLSREGFSSYWLNHHADHGRRTLIPPNTYSQLHQVEPDDSARTLTARLGVRADAHDGIAEVYFPNLAGFHAQMARAEVAVEALEDEKNFIWHERSTFGLYEVR